MGDATRDAFLARGCSRELYERVMRGEVKGAAGRALCVWEHPATNLMPASMLVNPEWKPTQTPAPMYPEPGEDESPW